MREEHGEVAVNAPRAVWGVGQRDMTVAKMGPTLRRPSLALNKELGNHWGSYRGENYTQGSARADAPPHSHLFSFLDSPAGADDNFVSSLKSHHFSHAVGCTRMVDVPANHRSENYVNREKL